MAKKKYFIPRRIPDFIIWHDNLNTNVPLVAATLNLPASDTTTTSTDNALVHTKQTVLQNARTALDVAQADMNATVELVIGHSQGTAGRAKASVNYNDTIGQQLRLIGEAITVNLSTSQPTLKLLGTPVQGDVLIDFNKSISDGVEIWSKRGNETEWTKLATDSEPEYKDTRTNLTAGPETRQYRARYVLNDAPIGNWSDVIVVTVPG